MLGDMHASQSWEPLGSLFLRAQPCPLVIGSLVLSTEEFFFTQVCWELCNFLLVFSWNVTLNVPYNKLRLHYTKLPKLFLFVLLVFLHYVNQSLL